MTLNKDQWKKIKLENGNKTGKNELIRAVETGMMESAEKDGVLYEGLANILKDITHKEKLDILKLTYANNNTLFHYAMVQKNAASGKFNAEVIKFLMNDMSDDELESVFLLKNDGGYTPSTIIFYDQSDEIILNNVNIIFDAFNGEYGKMRHLLTIKDAYNETFFENLIKLLGEYNDLTVKALGHAKYSDCLEDVLASQYMTNSTIIHKLCTTSNEKIIEFIKNADTKILLTEDNNGFVPLKELFENHTITNNSEHEAWVNDTLIPLTITALNDEDIGDGTKKLTIEAIEANEALKKVLIREIDLDAPCDLSAYFADQTLNDALTAAEYKLISELEAEDSDLFDPLKSSFDTISAYKAKFLNSLPESFGEKTIASIKNKLYKIEAEQQNKLYEKDVSKDNLMEIYNNIQIELDKFAPIYEALHKDQIDIKEKVTAIARRFVDESCSQENLIKMSGVEVKDCLDTVNLFINDLNIFAEDEIDVWNNINISIENYIKKQELSDSSLKLSMDHVFYLVTNSVVLNAVNAILSNDSVKKQFEQKSKGSYKGEALHKLMHLKSGSEEGTPGLNDSFYDVQYKAIYLDSVTGYKNNKLITKKDGTLLGEEFKADLEWNLSTLKEEACSRLSSKFAGYKNLCDEASLLENVREYCPKDGSINNNAEKLLCVKTTEGEYSFTGIDAVHYDTFISDYNLET
jgi:hypothetical protein